MQSRIVTVLLLLVIVGHSVQYVLQRGKHATSRRQVEIFWGIPGGPQLNHFVRKLMCPSHHSYIHGKCRRIFY
jgi:hypothetical protein